MNLDTHLSAWAAVGQDLILILAFSVAYYQLHATKRAAELTALMKIGDVFSTQHYREGRKFVREQLPQLLQDPSFQRELRDPGAPSSRMQPLLDFLNEWERIASYVELGALPEECVMRSYCSIFLRAWQKTFPAIKLLREGWPTAYEEFEKVSERAARWYKKHHPSAAAPGTPHVSTIKGDVVERRDASIPDRRVQSGADKPLHG